MQFQILNPLEYSDWNDRIASQGNDSFFNTAEWAQTLYEAYGFKPCYVTGIEAGKCLFLLPMMDIKSWMTGRRGVSLPFSDYCEPLGMSPSRAEALLGYLKDFGGHQGWRYFEIRNAKDIPTGGAYSARYVRHDLALTPDDAIQFDRLEGSVRTAIRKAIKEGVEISFSDTLNSVREFYALHCETRRRHGLPPQPFDFFKSMHRNIFARGKGLVVMARHAGMVVAAAVFCHHGRHALFKYGASDKRFQALRGSTLVMWEAIRRYARDGYVRLSLGRTNPANPGLIRFKAGWGADETHAPYVRYDLRQGRFISRDHHTAEDGYALIRRLPLSFSRMAGALLYKHMA